MFIENMPLASTKPDQNHLRCNSTRITKIFRISSMSFSCLLRQRHCKIFFLNVLRSTEVVQVNTTKYISANICLIHFRIFLLLSLSLSLFITIQTSVSGFCVYGNLSRIFRWQEGYPRNTFRTYITARASLCVDPYSLHSDNSRWFCHGKRKHKITKQVAENF